jgi:hypothetical protein
MKYFQHAPVPGFRLINDDSDLYILGKNLFKLFLAGLESLAQNSNPLLGDLGKHTLDIVANNHTELVLGDTPGLSMAVVGIDSGTISVVIIPVDWVEMCAHNPPFQFGGIVFVGSQVVDYYNGQPDMLKRARAFEAEYVKSLPSEILNGYQKKLLMDFPNGLTSNFMYRPKPVELVN